jgi:hypothetical protein
MGKTFVAVADDASAVYWNPAGLVQVQPRQVTAVYASLYEDTAYSFLGYSHPLPHTRTINENGVLGLGIVSLESRNFQLRDAFNEDIGKAGVSETAGIISYGNYLMMPFMSYGVSFKAVKQIIDSRSATGYGADIGCLLLVADTNITVGLSVQNIIAPKLKLNQATDEYPLSVTAGLSDRPYRNLLIAIDVNKTAKRDYKLHVGGEYLIAGKLSIRAGIDETELTCGAGFKLGNYSIDYAFAMNDAWAGHEDLGASHRIGFTAGF